MIAATKPHVGALRSILWSFNGLTVNLPAYAYGGSNPSRPTIHGVPSPGRGLGLGGERLDLFYCGCDGASVEAVDQVTAAGFGQHGRRDGT